MVANGETDDPHIVALVLKNELNLK